MTVQRLESINGIFKSDALHRWYLFGDDFRISYPGMVDQLVPANLLQKKHPDLPDAIRGLIAWDIQEAGCHFAFHAEVIGTLDLLMGNVLTVTGMEGGSHQIRDITRVSKPHTDVTTRTLHGTVVSVKSYEINGKLQHFVANSNTQEFVILDASLEASCPGWRDRYHVGEQLGLGSNELLDYAFKKPASAVLPAPALSDLNFD